VIDLPDVVSVRPHDISGLVQAVGSGEQRAGGFWIDPGALISEITVEKRTRAREANPGRAGAMNIEDMTPQQAYEIGYQNGESSLLADVNTLCDQLDIELDGRHEFDAIRAEINGLRAKVQQDELASDGADQV
jgi:hypothetical protein